MNRLLEFFLKAKCPERHNRLERTHTEKEKENLRVIDERYATPEELELLKQIKERERRQTIVVYEDGESKFMSFLALVFSVVALLLSGLAMFVW